MRLCLAEITFKDGSTRTFESTTKVLFEKPEVLELYNGRSGETLYVILQHAVTVEVSPIDPLPPRKDRADDEGDCA